MDATPGRARTFSSAIGDDAVRFNDRILISPAIGSEHNSAMSACTAFFAAGARAELPAPYEEIWVVLSGALRAGTEDHAVTHG